MLVNHLTIMVINGAPECSDDKWFHSQKDGSVKNKRTAYSILQAGIKSHKIVYLIMRRIPYETHVQSAA